MSEKTNSSAEAIDAAIVAHRAWVARFRSVMSGISTEKFDAVDIRNDRVCVFGKWLHADPECFGDPQVLNDIKTQHKYFHEIASQIAVMIRQGFPRDQVDLYMAEFDEMSKQLITQLMHIKSSLQD